MVRMKSRYCSGMSYEDFVIDGGPFIKFFVFSFVLYRFRNRIHKNRAMDPAGEAS